MAMKSVGAAEFKSTCLSLIDQVGEDRQPVLITKRGRPVAILSAIPASERKGIVGAFKGSVLRYDDPCRPAIEPDAWDANR